MKIVPHSRPAVGEEEAKAAEGVILSGRIAQGSVVDDFEHFCADFIGVKNGVAVSSGTAALHLSLLSLGVGPGDEVIVPDYACSALLNAVFHTGAEPMPVDIIPGDYNLDPESVRKALTPKTKAVLVVHAFGLPANVQEIKSFGLPVIEDIAQSFGASLNGSMTGSLGDMSVVSFYATKLMTTGEGGMIFSNSDKLIEKVRDLRDYDEKDDYSVRYNYKSTDIQAAIGLVQLKRLDGFIKKRRSVAEFYNASFKSLPVHLPLFAEDRGHIFFRYIIEVERPVDDVIESLYRMGVGVRRPVYKTLGSYLGRLHCRRSQDAWERAVSIPLYPSLSDEEIAKVADAVKSILG